MDDDVTCVCLGRLLDCSLALVTTVCLLEKKMWTFTGVVSYKFNMDLTTKMRTVIADVLRGNYFYFFFLYIIISYRSAIDRSVTIFKFQTDCHLFEILLVSCSSVAFLVKKYKHTHNEFFFLFDIEPTIKTLVIGYSEEVISCVGKLSAMTGAPVCRYVNFLDLE